MKIEKIFLVLTTLFILLGSNIAISVYASELSPSESPSAPSGEEGESQSGDEEGVVPNESGDTDSGDPTESGDSDVSGDLEDVLESIALDSNFTVTKNHTLDGAFEATTVNDEEFNFIIVTEPSHGTVSQGNDLSSPGFSYIPETDYVGNDSFTFRLESGDLYSNIGTIYITVEDTEITEPIIPFYYEDMQQHWANYSASHLAARGFIVGEKIANDYYFYADRTMTRGDFLVFLLSIVDPDGTASPADITFSDEDTTPDWLVEKAKIAYELGIIKGAGTSKNALYLYADHPITRAEAFIMIDNALYAKTNVANSKEEVKYEDKDQIPEWAMQAIMNLTSYKIIQGSGNMINANSILTKGQGAELAYKLLKELENSKLTPPEDLK